MWSRCRPGLEERLVPEDLGADLVTRQDPEGVAADAQLFSSSSLKSFDDDELRGLIGICEWYQSLFSSRVSRIS